MATIGAETEGEWVEVPPGPFVQSPTFGQVQQMAESVMNALGGPAQAAKQMNGEAYLTLCVLQALQPEDPAKLDLPIFGVPRLEAKREPRRAGKAGDKATRRR